jgi:hypothetical protein
MRASVSSLSAFSLWHRLLWYLSCKGVTIRMPAGLQHQGPQGYSHHDRDHRQATEYSHGIQVRLHLHPDRYSRQTTRGRHQC